MDKEQLSALLDGELDELATARLLQMLETDEDALAQWDAFSMIGDALREREGFSAAGAAGARRALAIIASEPVPHVSVMHKLQRPRSPALRPLVPWALAASAALVAFAFGSSTVGLQVAHEAGRPLRTMVAGVMGTPEPALDATAAPPEVVDRYMDFHRELADPGFQRTSFGGGSESGSAQGR